MKRIRRDPDFALPSLVFSLFRVSPSRKITPEPPGAHSMASQASFCHFTRDTLTTIE